MALAIRYAWLVLVAVLACSAAAMAQDGKGKKKDDRQPTRPLPDDKRLLALHLEFVRSAEKLGREYEGSKDWGKARAVYEEILKLVPQYPPAQAKLAEMLERESAAKSKVVTIRADEGWQDTGVTVLAGKPVNISANGSWVFQLKVDTNAEGLAIPKELRDFNPGCLIGMIVGNTPTPSASKEDKEKEIKPFVVGAGKQMMPNHSGRLYLRMYDTNPSDNEGALKVEIRGTFQESK
jgi:hypothetical protein